MHKKYEAWEDEDTLNLVFSTAEGIEEDKKKGLLGPNSKLIYTVYALTWEEANFAYHEFMDWEPYVPVGEEVPCPNACGALYYPEGSGECPNCG